MNTIIDRVGLGISATCLVHCLALPFVVVLLPSLGLFQDARWLHICLLIMAVPAAFLSFRRHRCRQHRQWLGLSFAVGIGLLGVALLPELGSMEKLLSAGGGVCLASGHLLALRMNRQARVKD